MECVDISDKPTTKRQHYVPKAYLKFFAFGDSKAPQVYALFCGKNQPKQVAIDDICCCSYLYDQIAIVPPTGDKIFAAPNEIEDSFIDIEGEYATIIGKIKEQIQSCNEVDLSSEEIEKLKEFMSLLMFRNPVFVHISNTIIDRLYAKDTAYSEQMRKDYPNIPANIMVSILADEFLKTNISPDVGILPRAMMATMESAQLCLLRTKKPMFITSDKPVSNLYGEKDGIQYDLLGMPITPDLYLAFADCDVTIPRVVLIDEESAKKINSRKMHKATKLLISNDNRLLLDAELEDISSDNSDDDNEWLYEMLHTDKETALKQYKDIMSSQRIKYWR